MGGGFSERGGLAVGNDFGEVGGCCTLMLATKVKLMMAKAVDIISLEIIIFVVFSEDGVADTSQALRANAEKVSDEVESCELEVLIVVLSLL